MTPVQGTNKQEVPPIREKGEDISSTAGCKEMKCFHFFPNTDAPGTLRNCWYLGQHRNKIRITQNDSRTARTHAKHRHLHNFWQSTFSTLLINSVNWLCQKAVTYLNLGCCRRGWISSLTGGRFKQKDRRVTKPQHPPCPITSQFKALGLESNRRAL